VLPNIGHSSVTARGSLLNDGLLRNPMKRSKLWLPLSAERRSGVVPSGSGGTSTGSPGAGSAVPSAAGFGDPTKGGKVGGTPVRDGVGDVSVVGFEGSSWASAGAPTSITINVLHGHCIGASCVNCRSRKPAPLNGE